MTLKRRKDDKLLEKIIENQNKMIESIAEIKTKTNLMHTALYGNGQPGMFAICNQRAGAIRAWAWIAGGGGLVAIAALLVAIFK